MRFPRVVAALFGVVVVAGCGDTSAGAGTGQLSPTSAPDRIEVASTATPSPAPSACPASGVVLSLREPSAAMGLRAMSIELRNCGERVYVLKGYPQVRLLKDGLEPIKVTVGHGSSSVSRVESFDQPPAEVTLKPGEVASAGILWRNLVTDNPETAVTADVLEITPMPGKPAERLLNAGIDLGTTRKIALSPWAKVREANGAETGDNAPHYGENHMDAGG